MAAILTRSRGKGVNRHRGIRPECGDFCRRMHRDVNCELPAGRLLCWSAPLGTGRPTVMGEAKRPEVRHIYQNHHLDTTRWDRFQPRRGDIVISTSYKAGTTLTQTIVANLLFPDGLPAK